MRKTNLNILVAACLFMMTLAVPAAAVTHYVSPGGSIQTVIDDANDGDEIEVAAGTYYEAINFNGKAVRLYSSGGPDVTTIDGTGNYHVVQCVNGEEPNTTLEGFTITGGNANGPDPNDSCGGGMIIGNSNPAVMNCIFSGNSADGTGGGMHNRDYSSPTVTDCNFSSNSASHGGGMYNVGVSYPTVKNCTFSGNEADSGGGGICNDGSGPTVAGCKFTGNSALHGGGIYNYGYSYPDVHNCTFSGNSAVNLGGGMCNEYYSSPIVFDCNFGGNHATGGGGMHNREHSSPTVTDCNFSSNSAQYGGGMDNFEVSYPTVKNCTFSGNEADSGGGGICNNGSGPTVAGCKFTGNSALHGGGIYNYGHSYPEVLNCTFSGNSAVNLGGGMCNEYYSSPIVFDCNFGGNHAAGGGGIHNREHSSPTVTECNFSGNTAQYGGGMDNVLTSYPPVKNCTFSDNEAGSGGGGICNNGSTPTVANCAFSGNSALHGAGLYNYDSSNTEVINCTFSGNSAVNVGGGMYNEYNSSPTVINCILWGDEPEEIFNNSSNPTVTYSDVKGGYSGTGNINADPCFVDAAGGDLRLLLSLSPCVDTGSNSVVSPTATDLAGNPRKVDSDGDGTIVVDMGAYELPFGVHNITRDIRYGYIQVAINRANYCDEIEVAPGTYKEVINFNGKAIRLYSSNGPDVTTIDGTGNYHVVQCVSSEGTDTIIKGFTITGGNANGPDPNDRCGGGMIIGNSNPAVMNCIFSGNSADGAGGGMYIDSSIATIINCKFSVNSSGSGGGIYNRGGKPNVTNCTFNGNSSGSGGGIYNENGILTVTNCILWGDEPDEVNDVNSSSVVTYSDVQGGWAGEGNIDKNPSLRYVTEGNLSLAPWSPCIDKGSNAAVVPYATDIVGLPRLVDGDCNGTAIVDMGAHELSLANGGDFDGTCHVDFGDYAFMASVWLSESLSGSWASMCDISIPADDRIDAGDLKVLAENWLQDLDIFQTCDPNRLKNIYGLDAAGAAYFLKEFCSITDIFSLEQMLYAGGYESDEYLEFTAIETVRKFAPVLYFDRVHKGLPMSAQTYFETVMTPKPDHPNPGQIKWVPDWDEWNGPCGKPGVTCLRGRDECTCGMQNTDFSTLRNGQVPTYYKVISDIDSNIDTGPKGRLRIAYWWFYGFQKHCNVLRAGPDVSHHGDWEFIWVTTDPSRSWADAVTYCFHGNYYTRQSGGFYKVGDRPVVYVGKIGHGNYHNDVHSGYGDGTPGHCCEYADYRDQTENSKWYNVHQNLVSLRGSEPWMLADRIGSPYEYGGREYIISEEKWRWGPHISYCNDPFCFDWTHTYACRTHPTIDTEEGGGYPIDWTKPSCKDIGCGDTQPGCLYSHPDFDQYWPWESGSMSSATGSATTATGVAVASCGRCGASRFGVLVRLGEYWLATP